MVIPINVSNYASTKGEPLAEVNKTRISSTLLARDYKGFSNYACTAALVIEEENEEIRK